MGTVAENLTTISNSLKDIKSALSSKGVSVTGDITTYGNAIRSIQAGSAITYLPCIRRVNTGYIDTGVPGANSNLRIEISFSLNASPNGTFNLFHSYVNDSTDATRAVLTGLTTTSCSLNSRAGSGITAQINRTTGRIYTESLSMAYASIIAYYSTGGGGSGTLAKGTALDASNTIKIFQDGPDGVDINLYSFRIYNRNNLIRDYIPCLINGKYGVIERLTGEFKESASGAFIDSGQVLPMNIE